MAKKRGTLGDPVVDGLIETVKQGFETIICYAMIESGPVDALKNVDAIIAAITQQRNYLEEKAKEYTASQDKEAKPK